MARIRSIKPDFFTSETIASLPLSARLTFVGLWTHADDNGVLIDSVKLIVAAVWPLEDDPLETLRRTQEDLGRLSSVGLIVRYVTGNRRFIFIRGWGEHQKVSHPGKPRYPLPPADLLTAATCTDADSPEDLEPVSGESPEDLANLQEILVPEQGAGSREQGAGNPPTPQRGKRGSSRAAYDYDRHPDFQRFWTVYPEKAGKGAALKAWLNAISRGNDPEAIIKAAERFRDDPRRNPEKTKHPQGWLNDERFLDQAAVRGGVSGGWLEN